MADVATTRAARPNAFRFSKVHRCKIYPGIGIARVGNSLGEYFIGPEAPCDPRDVTAPNGSFKDADGRIKRQAARFRIYAYDKNGNNLGELPLGSAKDRKARRAAQVEWKVHLKNKKGAWYQLVSRFEPPGEVRNADIPVGKGKLPDSRLALVIDPGARCINGEGDPVEQAGMPKSSTFDTGMFRGTPVPLGELKVDKDGRLLVLGGFGKSDSTKPDNPIGSDPAKLDFWANNDYWYDDVSDGPVTARVTLPSGKSIVIDRPQDAAWVIVAPPKYAPGIHSIVTLYDVIRDVAVDQGWIKDAADVCYFRDIYPILWRAAETSWVNAEARRGHGYDKRGDFRTAKDGAQPTEEKRNERTHSGPTSGGRTKVNAALLASHVLATADNSGNRDRIFRRIRNPLLDEADAADQANTGFMPLLSGDDGDRTEGEPRTWLSVLPSQYRKLKLWRDGKFSPGRKPKFPPLERMDPDEQVEALQRAALEPCVGGAFYPGIEAPWIVRDKDLYVHAFRINSKTHGPGDITKYMCVPWQADFYDCKNNWWPAARPDDVISQEVFEEANKAWRPGQPRISEALEGSVNWDRGLGVTTLFRRPWHNPAEAVDDPRDSERRGCDDMVRYWHELGFVLPRKTAWWEAGSSEREIVQVEMERRPHAGMDVRELFNCLLNLEENRSCLPKVREFVEDVLAAARRLQQTAGAFAFMDNIRPFKYDESIFDARMEDIYDDCADFAFTEKVNGVRLPYNPGDPDQNPFFRTREAVTERIRQLTPFNFLDGSWLRNIHRVGPVDEVNSILFTILKEELGDGVPSQNHANIYRDLCHSFGFYPPPIQSTAFARDPAFLDCAFDSPAFQLGISEFSRSYYPEIIGMSLWLEWTVMELHRIASIAEMVGLSSHFYRMHIAIDNAASGHGAEIIRAVKLYLRQVAVEGGEEAVQQHWKRIWDGYVAFAYTFVIVIRQVIRIVQEPPSLQQQLEWLIERKAPFGQFNHGDLMLGNSRINSLFVDPPALLQALQDNGYIIPGKPNESEFFKLLEFRGGPMYHVFTEDEIKLWRDWTWELGEEDKKRRGRNVNALRDRLATLNSAVVASISDAQLRTWQAAAADNRIGLWLEIANLEAADKGASSRTRGARAGASQQQVRDVVKSINDRFRNWLGWSMTRAVTYIAAQRWGALEALEFELFDPETKQEVAISTWFDRIRDAPNPAPPACAMLHSLGNALRTQPGLLKAQFAAGRPLAYAFDNAIPGNDGRTARSTLGAWIDAGCPLPRVPTGRVKPMRLEGSLSEQETHPTGVVMGFGTVH
jgi:hypothetical protein